MADNGTHRMLVFGKDGAQWDKEIEVMLSRKKTVGLSVLLLMLVYALYFVSRVPSQDGDWKVSYQVLVNLQLCQYLISYLLLL